MNYNIHPEISIIILTYNAPKYVRETIETLNEITADEDKKRIEIIVWDNNSDKPTKDILAELYQRNYIDILNFSNKNLYFAGGNNAAAKLASKHSKYLLLLNSDIRIVDKDWLSKLVYAKEKGDYAITSYGCCFCAPKRVDGYCYLIDSALYRQFPLNEKFQWWWSITKQQADILSLGRNILGFDSHERLLIHHGGKSGINLSEIEGNSTPLAVIMGWFNDSKGRVTFKPAPGVNHIIYYNNKYFSRIRNYIGKLLSKI